MRYNVCVMRNGNGASAITLSLAMIQSFVLRIHARAIMIFKKKEMKSSDTSQSAGRDWKKNLWRISVGRVMIHLIPCLRCICRV